MHVVEVNVLCERGVMWPPLVEDVSGRVDDVNAVSYRQLTLPPILLVLIGALVVVVPLS